MIHREAVGRVRDLFNGGYGQPPKARVKKLAGKKAKPARLPEPIAPPKHFSEIKCPCCKRLAGAPDLHVVLDYYRVPKLQAAILTAVWKGGGRPVANERIYDAMYADDPDGGPSPSRMAAALKECLHHLRGRLRGSGVSIETVGYRRGFRLVLGEK